MINEIKFDVKSYQEMKDKCVALMKEGIEEMEDLKSRFLTIQKGDIAALVLAIKDLEEYEKKAIEKLKQLGLFVVISAKLVEAGSIKGGQSYPQVYKYLC